MVELKYYLGFIIFIIILYNVLNLDNFLRIMTYILVLSVLSIFKMKYTKENEKFSNKIGSNELDDIIYNQNNTINGNINKLNSDMENITNISEPKTIEQIDKIEEMSQV